MYAPTTSSAHAVVSLRRHSALHRKRGLGQSLSDLLDVASVALGSGGSATDVLSSLTGAASDYLAPSQPTTAMIPYTPPSVGPSPVLLIGGAAVVGGLAWLVFRHKRRAS